MCKLGVIVTKKEAYKILEKQYKDTPYDQWLDPLCAGIRDQSIRERFKVYWAEISKHEHPSMYWYFDLSEYTLFPNTTIDEKAMVTMLRLLSLHMFVEQEFE